MPSAGRFNTSEPSAGRLESSDLLENQSSTGRPDLRSPDSHSPSAGRRVCTKRTLVAVFGLSLCILLAPGLDLQSHGFWAQGHHAIAVLAFEMLEPEEQNELIELLQHHPRFEQDFTIPDSIQGDEEAIHRWWIGVAGEWPDLIRGNAKYDRPTWHYQPGASVVIGDVEVPDDPGPLPDDATMETRELYIVQAIELCKKVLHDESQPKADRALAICWLAHLVADAHQPCHAGSLYSPKAFPNGDRGANLIPIKGQGDIRNLHAFWDSLLGAEATPESVEKRVAALKEKGKTEIWNQLLQELMRKDGQALIPDRLHAPADGNACKAEIWVFEGRAIARTVIYSPDVVSALRVVERGLVKDVEHVLFSVLERSSASKVAHACGGMAGQRLQLLLRQKPSDSDRRTQKGSLIPAEKPRS